MFYVRIALLGENCDLLALGHWWGRHEDPNHSSYEGDGNEIKQRSRDKDYCSQFLLRTIPERCIGN